MKAVRVLFVSGGSLDHGGISSWMLNFASRFERERVAVDFLVHGQNPGAREDEAVSLGAKVYHVPYRRDDPAGNRRGMEKAIASGYDIVHAHMDGMNAYPLGLAKRCGVGVRISHSHNTDFLTTNPLRRAAHTLARSRIPRCATHLLACSEAAGAFLYGENRVKSGVVKIVRNAIDIERYKFDPAARGRVRSELGLADARVIGHVGRFDLRQKNQLFLLDAFSGARKLRPDLKLVLVGDGEDRPAIEARVRALDLDGDVVLTGFRDDIPALLSAFDAFALPSRFEGLGIVLVEAQANGLPCIASGAVPREANVTNCRYLPLTSEKAWADAFAEKAEAPESRMVSETDFQRTGYDIRQAADTLQRFYLEVAK